MTERESCVQWYRFDTISNKKNQGSQEHQTEGLAEKQTQDKTFKSKDRYSRGSDKATMMTEKVVVFIFEDKRLVLVIENDGVCQLLEPHCVLLSSYFSNTSLLEYSGAVDNPVGLTHDMTTIGLIWVLMFTPCLCWVSLHPGLVFPLQMESVELRWPGDRESYDTCNVKTKDRHVLRIDWVSLRKETALRYPDFLRYREL